MIRPEKITAIVAIVQISKYYGVPSKFLPVLALILGAVLEYSENPTSQGILDGIILGAITTGSYGVIKGSARGILGTSTNVEVRKSKITNNKSENIADLEPDDYRGV